MMRRIAFGLLALATLLAPLSCATGRVRTQAGVAEPFGADFFEYPEKYQGRTVRLVNMAVARTDITRPLVLVSGENGRGELTVNDGRSLANRQGIRTGDRVAVKIECTEGRLERGNLLLAIDPWPAR